MHNRAYTTLEAAEILEDVKSTLSPKALETPELNADEFDALMAFLKSLTSPTARDLEHTIPESVPSGLKMVLPVPENE